MRTLDSPRWCGECDGYGDHHTDRHHLYVTNTGKVLTNEDIQALADEAEQGYDVSHLQPRKDTT